MPTGIYGKQIPPPPPHTHINIQCTHHVFLSAKSSSSITRKTNDFSSHSSVTL